jgi:hypothetical protein
MEMTGLSAAITEGDVDAVEEALAEAAKEVTREGGAPTGVAAAVNKEDPGTWLSPLHHAARRGSVAITKVLLLNGSDPNLEDVRGRTCLHDACDAYAADETGDFWQGEKVATDPIRPSRRGLEFCR